MATYWKLLQKSGSLDLLLLFFPPLKSGESGPFVSCKILSILLWNHIFSSQNVANISLKETLVALPVVSIGILVCSQSGERSSIY